MSPRVVTIDGRDYTVESCRECMFSDGGDDGYGCHCNHPLIVDPWSMPGFEDAWYYGNICQSCPLREAVE